MTQTSEEAASGAALEEPTWRAEVERAARDLAAAIAETREVEAFDHVYTSLRDDQRAQEAMRAYQEKQSSLQMMVILNAVSAEQRAELERLREAWLAEPSVKEYLAAQASLSALSQAVDRLLSEHIGLGFAAACRPSCCG